MIILDHNLTEDHAEQLARWRIRHQKIGREIGRPEWDDQQEILRYLHQAKKPTLFTRDGGFFRYHWCHANYCLAVIDADETEVASLIRRFLRHSAFKTKAQRCGKVIKVSPRKIAWWEKGQPDQQNMIW